MTALSSTLKDFCIERGYENLDSLNMIVPFSMRKPPIGINDFEFKNEFTSVPIKFKLVSDVQDGVYTLSKDMATLKTSLAPVGCTYASILQTILPEFMRSMLLESALSKVSLGFSNVPGPKRPFTVGGTVCKNTGFIMAVKRSITAALSIISHYDTLKVGISLDKSLKTDPYDLMDRFEAKLDSMLPEGWRDFKSGQQTTE